MGILLERIRRALAPDEYTELERLRQRCDNHIEELNEANRRADKFRDMARMERERADSVRDEYNELVKKHNAVCLKLQQVCEAVGKAGASVNRNGYTADGSRAFVDTSVMDHLIDTAVINEQAAMAAHNDVLITELARLAMTALPTNTSRADVAVWLNARAGDHCEAYNRAMRQ